MVREDDSTRTSAETRSGPPSPRRSRPVASALTLCALLIGVAGLGGKASSPPTDPNAARCGTSEDYLVVTAGASMTRGSVSSDWVGALRERLGPAGIRFVNAGVNGDTSADLLARVDRDVVACDPDAVTVLIGTNDVRTGVPLDRYRANLDAILARTREGTDARLAVGTLPPLGPDRDSDANRRLPGYNEVIRDLAEQHGVTLLPVGAEVREMLGWTTPPPPSPGERAERVGAVRPTPPEGAASPAVSTAARVSSSAGGVYSDNLHLTDRGGTVLVRLVGDWLRGAG
ncbi:Lysophospholipase L1 [Actinoalloteichus cyanogriseus DSM 43889]|uniref:Lysophospholipase L1 n=1 Tax=Actinoalloteichus caeruleus DSM 43889 TaxID=1120930 RepID=A0ABT1JI56_ACTCY|nr:Lysophospholipase L1 [Actinoalloteichus caeruleus DSM 43889]